MTDRPRARYLRGKSVAGRLRTNGMDCWVCRNRACVRRGLSWFSLKWRTSLPEIHLSGRPSPGFECSFLHRCLAASPRGIYRFGANPEGMGRAGRSRRVGTAHPSVLAPCRRSGRFPPLSYPPPRSPFMIPLGNSHKQSSSGHAQATAIRAACRVTFRRARASSSLRSRSAKIVDSRPASLSAGAM